MGAIAAAFSYKREMERQNEYVLRAVEERGIKLIRLWFTDVVGQLKSVAISPAELETALEGVSDDLMVSIVGD